MCYSIDFTKKFGTKQGLRFVSCIFFSLIKSLVISVNYLHDSVINIYKNYHSLRVPSHKERCLAAEIPFTCSHKRVFTSPFDWSDHFQAYGILCLIKGILIQRTLRTRIYIFLLWRDRSNRSLPALSFAPDKISCALLISRFDSVSPAGSLGQHYHTHIMSSSSSTQHSAISTHAEILVPDLKWFYIHNEVRNVLLLVVQDHQASNKKQLVEPMKVCLRGRGVCLELCAFVGTC